MLPGHCSCLEHLSWFLLDVHPTVLSDALCAGMLGASTLRSSASRSRTDTVVSIAAAPCVETMVGCVLLPCKQQVRPRTGHPNPYLMDPACRWQEKCPNCRGAETRRQAGAKASQAQEGRPD